MSESPKSEETIFSQAIDLPAAERSAWLDQACGDNAALRLRVEALLRVHDEAGNLLDDAPAAPSAPPWLDRHLRKSRAP